jgi:LPS export ABC transporter protein LptC
MNKKTVFLNLMLILLITLASVSAWLIAKSSLDKPKIGTEQNQIDFFMTNVSYINLDSNGAVHDQLTAMKVIHYTSENASILQYPHLMIIDKDQKIWNISANNGKSLQENNTVYLWDNVNIKQFDPTTNAYKMIVATAKATIYPRSKLGETDQPIAITEGQNVIHAIGAKVDFNKSTVKLLSKVMGKYK